MPFSVEYIYRVLDKMSPVFNKMAASSSKFQGKFTAGFDKVEKGFKKAGQKLANFQTGLTSLGAGLTFKKIITETNDFNESLAKIGTLIPGQQDRLGSLKETITDVAISMGKDLTDISGGAFQVISAFGDMAGETEGRIAAVSKAAVAGGSTTVEALNLLSAVTKGYGDTSAEALSKASDLAFMTNKLGQTTFPELAASIGLVVPTAAKLGVTQEQLFASYAALTGVTGNTAAVSTQLSAILTGMLKPTEAMKAAVAKLGFESSSTMVRQVGLGESLKLLTEITGGDEEAMAALFGRVQALRGVFALSGSQADKYSSSLVEMMKVSENVGTVTNEAFLEITEGINKTGFSMKQVKTKIQAFVVSLGDNLAPVLNDIMKKYITPLLAKFKALSPATKRNIVMIIGITAAVGAVLIPLGLMLSTIGSIIGVMKGVTIISATWSVVMALLTGLTGAQGLATGATTAQIVAYKIGTLLAAGASKVWAVAQGILNVIMANNVIALVVVAIGTLVTGMILAIKYWDIVSAAIKKAWSWFVKVWDTVKGLAFFFGGPFIAPMVIVIEYIRSIVTSWGTLTKAFKEKGILSGILAIGKAILAGLISPIESFLNLVSKIPGVGNLAKGAAEKIKSLREGLQGMEGGIDIGPQIIQPNPFEPRMPEVPIPKSKDVNVTTQSNISVYTEPGMNVLPFMQKGKLGYQLAEQAQG